MFKTNDLNAKFLIIKTAIKSFTYGIYGIKIYRCENSTHLLKLLFDVDSRVSINNSKVLVLQL